MSLSGLAGEERQLLARLDDLCEISGQRNIARFSQFLNERQVLVAEQYLRRSGAGGGMLCGGHAAAVRRMAGFFPHYRQPNEEDFPITALTLHLPAGHSLTHRDVLGSLIGLGITRESVGDILPGERHCHVFVAESVGGLVLDELRKIGRSGVRVEHGIVGPLAEPRFEPLRGTVSSMRLDCVVSMLTGRSREKSASLIASEQVQLNYAPDTNISRQVSPGDTLTVRGWGKYKVDAVGAPTKKGRLPVTCRKYA